MTGMQSCEIPFTMAENLIFMVGFITTGIIAVVAVGVIMATIMIAVHKLVARD